MSRPCAVCGATGKQDSPSGEIDCVSCMGRGWVDSEEPTGTSAGGLGLFALIALALSGLLALLLAIEIWMRADDALRPLLEALPGNAVAETAEEHGNPVLIGVLTAATVLGAAIGLSWWRRGLIREYLRGELRYPALLGASLVRMTVIVLGIALIPVLAAIADGADLREGDPEGTLFDAAWRPLVAGAGLLVFTYLGLRRTIGSVSSKPLPVGDPIPAESYRR
jgi:hypothetical protein